MKFEGAIFDLDGTLLDSMGFWNNVGERYLRNKGIEPNAELARTLKTMSFRQAAQHFINIYSVKDDENTITKDIVRLVEHQYRHDVQLKDGVSEFLTELKAMNIKMCIATASDRLLAEAALRRLDIFDCFCALITCEEAGAGKDSPDIFLKALKQLGTQKGRTVVFEDSLYAVITAKRAGFQVAGVFDPSSEDDTQQIKATADYFLYSFTEWKDILLF